MNTTSRRTDHNRGGPTAKHKLQAFLAANSILLVALVLFVVFSLLSPVFLKPSNFVNILRQMSVVATLGIGLTIVIIMGGIDLSVGSVLFLSAGVAGLLLQQGVAFPLVLLAALGSAALVGLLNGLVIEVAALSPVIVTLGTLIGVRGAALVLMDNAQIRITDPTMDYLAVTRLPPVPALNLPGIPLTVVLVLMLVLLAAVLMRTTTFGRAIHAIGGNPRASYLAGLPITRIKVLGYVFCSLTAGIAGILMAASTGVVSPNLGSGIEFFAIAAVVLGGTQLTGGVGRVEKSLVGAVILYMVLNFMTIRRVPTEWQQTATGLILIAAIIVDRLVQKRDYR